MNKIAFPLTLRMQGPQVADLQDALQLCLDRGALLANDEGARRELSVELKRERLEQTGDPIRAALEAGFVRCRPVLMTALAMIIGMAPTALGLGDGGEENAPLGRAVIGGLIFATCATLMFVPVVFSIFHGRPKTTPETTPKTTPLPVPLGEPNAA